MIPTFMLLIDIVTVSKKFKFLMYADDTTIYYNLVDFSGINGEENMSNEQNIYPQQALLFIPYDIWFTTMG